MRVEILRAPWLSAHHPRQQDLLQNSPLGLKRQGHHVSIVSQPTWTSEWIVLWGLGHPRAQELLREALGRKIRVVAFDLGYWNRMGSSRSYRVSIDDAHPQKYVMARDRSSERLRFDRITLREDANPDGHVVLVGIGHKSAATYGESPGAWEDQALAKIQRAWPGREVVFRPKPGGGTHRPQGVRVVDRGGIEEILRGAAAVYCRQSNVAVDAIIAGVPAVAEDGAAAAVCDTSLREGVLPSPLSREVRMRFLQNLAWFQWRVGELPIASTWKVIEDISRSAK